MSDRYIPRVVVDVTPELMQRVQDLIPWGVRNALMIALIEDVLDLVEKNGDYVIALYIMKKLKARNLMLKETKDGTQGPQS